MMTPGQGQRYLGPITDTSRWDTFRHRSDDIFICTPAKCGTTWTQAICTLLVFGKVDHGQQPSVISPWVDSNFDPLEPMLERIDGLPHRRFLKTHSPFDGIPYHATCSYLVIFRDPRDVFFSGQNHKDNMSDQGLAKSVFGDGDGAFDKFLSGTPNPDAWDQQTLPTMAYLLDSYWPYRHLPNVHLHHYSDMKADLRGEIEKISSEIGVATDSGQLDAFTEAASFSSMKANAEQYAPNSGTGMWKAETNFFANGTSGQWKNRLSAAQQEKFHARLNELLDEESARWLLEGGQKNL